ncbi:MAG: carbon monoxide dehydrogenase subunit [Symbiobacteriaceae bacterium]|jgi:carbon monoxide dehydrogenase subunit G|nr:carbon monoxide dehydrogenase subunit [Symbiobacteriaceae bacterium]
MQVAGEFVFQAGRDAVWQLLNDPEVLGRCLPGCEQLVPVAEDRYAAKVRVGLAAVKGTYEGSLAVTDKQAPAAMTLRIDMKGTTGFVAIAGRMLFEAGEPDAPAGGEGGVASTRVAYDWDVKVGGPVAMVGQRVLGGVAKWIIGEFFAAAKAELAARGSAV